MNAMTQQNFRPSADMIRVAEALMVAMAHEQLVRPVVEAYENAILAKHQFPVSEQDSAAAEKKTVLDRKDAFLLSDDDFLVYHAECLAARDAAKLKVSKPENCPLLEAETMRIEAENALIKQLGNIQGMETFKENNCVMTLELRASVIDIGLKLVAPFVDDATGVLQRYMKG